VIYEVTIQKKVSTDLNLLDWIRKECEDLRSNLVSVLRVPE
jgi:hypothetical protein